MTFQIKRLSLALVSIYLLVACTHATPSAKDQNKAKAIFVIVDGIPADVIEKASTPYIDEINVVGSYTRAITGGEIGAQTENPTISAVGYMNLITGTWANKHNVWDNKVEQPNYKYWDIFRIARTYNPTMHTALFSTWEDNRTKLIGDGLPKAGGNKLSYVFDGFENDTDRFPHDEQHSHIGKIDDLVASEAARYLKTQAPDLSWVYLEYTDSVAHGLGDSPRFIEEVQNVDSRVGMIWDAIKHREKNYNEDWLIVVTTDHGRDAVTGKDHGGQSDRERTIWISTNSNRLNAQFGNNTSIVDILPSIVTHLNITMPAEVAARLDGISFIGEH